MRQNKLFLYISKLVTINFLWIVTAFLGFGIFTLFPASIALYVIIKTMHTGLEFPLLRSFITIFKREYVKSQKVMIQFLVPGIIIIFDLYYFYQQYMDQQGVFNLIGLILFIIFMVIYLLAFIHIFPVYVYFPNLSPMQTVKKAFIMIFKNIFQSIYILFIHLLFFLVAVFILPELFMMYPLIYFALMAYIALKVLRPGYMQSVGDHSPLDVQNYIHSDYVMGVPMDIKQCRLIAHRGLSSQAPENSIAAFKKAAELGFFGIEADIRTTKDDVFIMFHDDTLNRMTKRKGKIHMLEYGAIKDLVLTGGNRVTDHPNEKIPRLEDYLMICRDYNKVPVAEIKYVNHNDNLDQIVGMMKSYALYDKAIIISFNLNYLIYLREHYPDLQLQYIVSSVTPTVIQQCQQYQLGIDVGVGKLTRAHIRQCKEAGLTVNVWTVDDPKVAQKLIDDGVDYITSNVYFG